MLSATRASVAAGGRSFLLLSLAECADMFGVRRFPDIRQQRLQVRRATRQTFQHVAQVLPGVQVVTVRAADHREDRRRPASGVLTPQEQPVLPLMPSSA
jgi:hypothetical protein